MEIDVEKIGVKVQPLYGREVNSYRLDTSKVIRIRIWLFWKNQEYPLNYIGGGRVTISRELGISQEEARLLLISKLEGLLPTVEDMTLKNAVEKRIKYYTTFREIPFKCRKCKKEFVRTNKTQRYCPDCKKSYEEKLLQKR